MGRSTTHGPERSPRWLCRFDRITNHESPFDALTLAQGRPLTFHFSSVTNPSPSHCSLITSHLSRPHQRRSGTGRLSRCAQVRPDKRQRICRAVALRRRIRECSGSGSDNASHSPFVTKIGLKAHPEFVTSDLSFGHKIRFFLQLSRKRSV
jgi:hypothetical protein